MPLEENEAERKPSALSISDSLLFSWPDPQWEEASAKHRSLERRETRREILRRREIILGTDISENEMKMWEKREKAILNILWSLKRLKREKLRNVSFRRARESSKWPSPSITKRNTWWRKCEISEGWEKRRRLSTPIFNENQERSWNLW